MLRASRLSLKGFPTPILQSWIIWVKNNQKMSSTDSYSRYRFGPKTRFLFFFSFAVGEWAYSGCGRGLLGGGGRHNLCKLLLYFSFFPLLRKHYAHCLLRFPL